MRATAPLAVRTRAMAPDGAPCADVDADPFEVARTVDETAKRPAKANPARLRNPFRLVVGSLSMRRKSCLLKVPLIAMATVFSDSSQNIGT